MAISSAMMWEIRQTAATANNGGGFRGSPLFSPPSTPVVNGSGSGGTVAANTYYCVITYSGAGETGISSQQLVTTTGTTSSFVVTSPSDPGLGGGVLWNLYVGTTSGGPYFPQGTSLVIGANRTVTTTPPTSGVQPPGTDRTLSDNPQVTIDNSAITATTAGANSNVLTFTLGYTPTGADVGNVVKMTAGTNITAGYYEITAITSTTWTVTGVGNLTTAGGAGSAIVGKMGGAADHPGTIMASTGAVANNIIFWKYNATAYLCGSSANVSGGKMNPSQANLIIQGYNTTRSLDNTDTLKPIFNANAASLTMFAGNATGQYLKNVSFTNSGANATLVGISLVGTSVCERCSCDSIASSFTSAGSSVRFIDCASTNSTGGIQFDETTTNPSHLLRCYCGPVASGTAVAINLKNNNSLAEHCIVSGGGGIGIDMATGVQAVARHCTVYNCANFGIRLSNDNLAELCISYGNGSSGTVYGFSRNTGSSAEIRIKNCAGGGNFSGNLDPALWNNGLTVVNFQALSGNPFTNAAGGDFSLNNTVGAGASCRGIAVTLPGISTTSNPDIGAVQSTGGTGAIVTQRPIVIQNIGTY